jgi:hypothetical protein
MKNNIHSKALALTRLRRQLMKTTVRIEGPDHLLQIFFVNGIKAVALASDPPPSPEELEAFVKKALKDVSTGHAFIIFEEQPSGTPAVH